MTESLAKHAGAAEEYRAADGVVRERIAVIVLQAANVGDKTMRRIERTNQIRRSSILRTAVTAVVKGTGGGGERGGIH
jgi:hypothetical protein